MTACVTWRISVWMKFDLQKMVKAIPAYESIAAQFQLIPP